MSAGLAMLKKLKSNPDIYKELESKAKKLMKGFEEISKANGIDIQTNVVGSMFGFFFNSKKPENFDDVNASNTKRYAKFHSEMLKRGFYFAPSAYETGFICTVMNDGDIDATLKAYEEIAPSLK
jgi:glutamate-1-semialdehyde 2,1-aminomutase